MHQSEIETLRCTNSSTNQSGIYFGANAGKQCETMSLCFVLYTDLRGFLNIFTMELDSIPCFGDN